jgi:hypothetical protein
LKSTRQVTMDETPLLARLQACCRDPLSEGFRHFVASMPAPVASGWSDSPGGPRTHWKAPPCHGAPPKPSFEDAPAATGGKLSVRSACHRSAEACHNGTPAGLFPDRQQHQTGIRGTCSNPHLPEQRTPKQCVAACSQDRISCRLERKDFSKTCSV